MDELTIDKMPEDAIVEVFKWLDPESSKIVSQTCKQ